MNDGMYTNIRNYLEEIAGQQKQILAAVQRTNELLELSQPTEPGVINFDDPDSMTVAPDGSVTAKPKPKTAAKKPAKAKPAVNWNS